MNRRSFMAGASLSILGEGAVARAGPGEIAVDGTHFRFRHGEDRLFCEFMAQTRGWMAVGFNDQQRLQGTRFVIAARKAGTVRVEEHIAQPPRHPTVGELGLLSAVGDAEIDVSAGRSLLRFSLPHRFPDTDNPNLSPGSPSYLMLAWSHETDFAHHSAWRKHFSIEL